MSETASGLKSPAITVPCLVAGVMAILRFCVKYALRNVSEGTDILLTVSVIQLVIFILPCILYYLLKRRRLETEPFFHLIKPNHLVFVIVSALFLVCGILLAKYCQIVIFDDISSTSGFNEVLASGGKELSTAGVFLSCAVIPAVCEELFYRGVGLSEYRVYGSANAVLVSALCFAFLHFSFRNFVLYFFAGLVLGMVAVVTRSLLASVLLHLLSNTLSLYGSDYFLRVTVQKSGEFFMGFLLIALFGLSAVFLLSRLEHVYITYAERPPVGSLPPRSRDHFLRVFFSPSFLVLIAVFIVFTAFL